MSEHNDKLRTTKELHDKLDNDVDAGLSYNLLSDCISKELIKTFHEFNVAHEEIEWAVEDCEEFGSSDRWIVLDGVEKTIKREREYA
jgi:hypothetical protein